MSDLVLIDYTVDHLALVRPWFTHPEVQRRLGGPSWPERELELLRHNPESEYRGRRVLRAHSWVVLDGDIPVAKVGGDVYDRWTVWDGRSEPGHVTSSHPGPAMGLSYVVDPEHWGEGLGQRSLLAALAHPAVGDVRVFVLGIDSDNHSSIGAARRAGFSAATPKPDWEDTVYYLYHR